MNVLFISLCIYFLHFAIVAYRTQIHTHAQRTSSRRLWLDWKVFLKTLFELLNSSYRFAFQSGFVSRQLNEIDFYSAISHFSISHVASFFHKYLRLVFQHFRKYSTICRVFYANPSVLFHTNIRKLSKALVLALVLGIFTFFRTIFHTDFHMRMHFGAGKKAQRHKWALKVHFRCVKHTIIAERPPFCWVKYELCLTVLTVCPRNSMRRRNRISAVAAIAKLSLLPVWRDEPSLDLSTSLDLANDDDKFSWAASAVHEAANTNESLNRPTSDAASVLPRVASHRLESERFVAARLACYHQLPLATLSLNCPLSIVEHLGRGVCVWMKLRTEPAP